MRPDFFMVDDDTRLVWPPVPGCFCPIHLAKLAAIRLVERGLEDEIGVKAKAWSGPTIQFQEFADGVRQSDCRRDKVADLSCLLPGAKELSGLYNRLRMGDPARKVAPGSVLFANAFIPQRPSHAVVAGVGVG